MDALPPPPIRIDPPLLNSACPWATTLEDLRALFECPSTGAVTTRTSLLRGFPHDPSVHQYTFFDPSRHEFPVGSPSAGEEKEGRDVHTASLNTLGYSPIPLDDYLSYISTISSSSSSSSGGSDGPASSRTAPKWFIVSVTGTPDEVAECYRRIARLKRKMMTTMTTVTTTTATGHNGDGAGTDTAAAPRHPPLLAMEVNLSCPNIPGKPPPAYSGPALAPYLATIRDAATAERGDGDGEAGLVPWGLKTPPYTHADQFETLVETLRGAAAAAAAATTTTTTTTSTEGDGNGGINRADDGPSPKQRYCPVSFLTATNTLGSCLVLDTDTDTSDDDNNSSSSGGGGGGSGGSGSKREFKPRLAGGTGTGNGTGEEAGGKEEGGTQGIGGMAGAPLHPLALGNVATLRRLLAAHPETRHVALLGVGGVADPAGYRRMRAAGADAVGVATALGRRGVAVFEEIEAGKWG